MKRFEENSKKQPWWRLLKDSQRDLAAEMHCLGSSSMVYRSIDEPMKKENLHLSERTRFNLCSHICWLTVANALMFGVTIVLHSLGNLSWSTTDVAICVQATSFYCERSIPKIVLLSTLTCSQRQ